MEILIQIIHFILTVDLSYNQRKKDQYLNIILTEYWHKSSSLSKYAWWKSVYLGKRAKEWRWICVVHPGNYSLSPSDMGSILYTVQKSVVDEMSGKKSGINVCLCLPLSHCGPVNPYTHAHRLGPIQRPPFWHFFSHTAETQP